MPTTIDSSESGQFFTSYSMLGLTSNTHHWLRTFGWPEVISVIQPTTSKYSEKHVQHGCN